jgi:hypothetical protein
MTVHGNSGAAQRPETPTAGPMRTEPCACGGEIRAPRNEPAPWVREHNEGSRHMEWRARMGL